MRRTIQPDMWMLVLIMVIGGGVLFAMKRPLQLDSSLKTGGAPVSCPACGSFFPAAGAPGAIVRCNDCGAYGEMSAQREVQAIREDFVSPRHVFQTYLPEAPKWPPMCCVCNAAATRTDTMNITYASEPTFEEKMTAHAVVGVASLGTMKVASHQVNVTERYKVPHCDQHEGGALLVPAGISFRSYAYYRKFVQANRASVGS